MIDELSDKVKEEILRYVKRYNDSCSIVEQIDTDNAFKGYLGSLDISIPEKENYIKFYEESKKSR